MTAAARAPFEIRGWHVLVALVSFFATVAAIDGGFAIQAYRTFPGEVSATPYEDGLRFNRTLAERDAAQALGWRASILASVVSGGASPASGRVRLKLTIQDHVGQPVRGLTVAGRLERPATEAGALTPAFTETRPGIYEAIAPETPGAWDLTLNATDPSGHRFHAESRLTWR
jgi:nitrogen fixation protein FixH